MLRLTCIVMPDVATMYAIVVAMGKKDEPTLAEPATAFVVTGLVGAPYDTTVTTLPTLVNTNETPLMT